MAFAGSYVSDPSNSANVSTIGENLLRGKAEGSPGSGIWNRLTPSDPPSLPGQAWRSTHHALSCPASCPSQCWQVWWVGSASWVWLSS